MEWAGHRRLSLSTDQVLFLPVRTEAYRGRFASEPFYGTLVRMEAKTAWSTLRAMHSDLGESISRAWNDPCMLRAALWSEALFSALDYMQLGHIGDYYVIKALEVLFLLHAQREGLALTPQCDYHTQSQIETIREIQKYMVGHLDERLTVRSLSQQFRISGTALKSCFRQVYGVPVHQYLLEQRMARARSSSRLRPSPYSRSPRWWAIPASANLESPLSGVTICRPPNSAGTQIKIHLQRFLTRTDRKTSNSYVIISDRNKVPCLAREGLSNEAPPFLGLGRCYLHGHDFHYRVPAPLNVR